MSHLFRLVAILSVGLAGAATGANELPREALVVGVLPYNSAPVVIGQHRPMIDHLRAEFGADLEVVTATGFRVFFETAANGGYDLMVIPSHFARVLQRDHGYVPLVRYESGARGLVVAAAKGPVSGHEQLAGRILAVPDRTALATILVLEWLERKGLRVGRDYSLFEATTFNAAAISVERGETSAAVSAPSALTQMAPATRQALRTIVDTGEYPNLIFLAHSRLTQAVQEKLKQSLLAFGASPEGNTFFKSTGFLGIVAVTPQLMRQLDPYVADTRRVLGLQPSASTK